MRVKVSSSLAGSEVYKSQAFHGISFGKNTGAILNSNSFLAIKLAST